MSNIEKYKKTIIGIVSTILFLVLLTMGSMAFLELGRYLGTIIRYALEGNVCFF